MIRYHDKEWGVPVHDDRKQFEFLMMEVMQCGLNWNMIIQKREIFRRCFDDFDFDKVAISPTYYRVYKYFSFNSLATRTCAILELL